MSSSGTDNGTGIFYHRHMILSAARRNLLGTSNDNRSQAITTAHEVMQIYRHSL